MRAVNILGKKTVISLFEETREVEASGGLLIMVMNVYLDMYILIIGVSNLF